MLAVREGKKTDRYRLYWMRSDQSIGRPALRLVKFGSGELRDLIKREFGWGCTCEWGEYGFPRTGEYCRHIKALRKLGVID